MQTLMFFCIRQLVCGKHQDHISFNHEAQLRYAQCGLIGVMRRLNLQAFIIFVDWSRLATTDPERHYV